MPKTAVTAMPEWLLEDLIGEKKFAIYQLTGCQCGKNGAHLGSHDHVNNCKKCETACGNGGPETAKASMTATVAETNKMNQDCRCNVIKQKVNSGWWPKTFGS